VTGRVEVNRVRDANRVWGCVHLRERASANGDWLSVHPLPSAAESSSDFDSLPGEGYNVGWLLHQGP